MGCVDAAINRKRRVKHVYMAMSKHTITEELLEVMFSVRPMHRPHNKGQWEKLVVSQPPSSKDMSQGI
jgi:hypothetical protein